MTLTFLNQDGTVESLADTLPATSRRTCGIGRTHLPSLATAAGVSTVVESTLGLPPIVERSMFWTPSDYHGGHGGHGGTAVASAERRWCFGEGSQGFFDTCVLLANSGVTPAQVTVTFLLDAVGMAPVVVHVPMGAHTRETLWAGNYPGLVERAFSIACRVRRARHRRAGDVLRQGAVLDRRPRVCRGAGPGHHLVPGPTCGPPPERFTVSACRSTPRPRS